jgi:hypothetical protein
MSTTPQALNPTVAAITTDTLTYTPAVIAGVQAAEVTGASGPTKLQAVVNGVLAGSAALEATPNSNVAAIAALTNLIVSIFNATGIFSHKKAA